MPAYDAQCSNCNAPFKAPVPPEAGTEILCAQCYMMNQDFSQHPFFIQLEAFFREKFGKDVQAFQVTRSRGDYNLLIQLKDRNAPYVCKVELSVSGRDTVKPQPVLVQAHTGDVEFEVLLAEFTRKRQDKRFRMDLN